MHQFVCCDNYTICGGYHTTKQTGFDNCVKCGEEVKIIKFHQRKSNEQKNT